MSDWSSDVCSSDLCAANSVQERSGPEYTGGWIDNYLQIFAGGSSVCGRNLPPNGRSRLLGHVEHPAFAEREGARLPEGDHQLDVIVEIDLYLFGEQHIVVGDRHIKRQVIGPQPVSRCGCAGDRKSVVEGTRVSVRVDLGGRRLSIKK